MQNKINIRVEIDPSCDEPEVVIRAKEKTKQIDEIIAAIGQCGRERFQRITVYRDAVSYLLDQKDIFRLYTENRKVIVCTQSGTYEARVSLQGLEELLNPEFFVRISRFELINLNRVRSFDMSITGTIKMIFEDGSSTWVARRCVRAIEQRLAHFGQQRREER